MTKKGEKKRKIRKGACEKREIIFSRVLRSGSEINRNALLVAWAQHRERLVMDGGKTEARNGYGDKKLPNSREHIF